MEIKKLTPDMADQYVHFFDVTPHDDNIDEHKCYCVNWISDDGDGLDFSTAEKRRAAAHKFVSDGVLKGYVAMENGEIIGWLNANEKNSCLSCPGWRWYMQEIPASPEKTLAIFCFVISPAYQRKGVATALLERAVSDAKSQGFDCIEAYPNAEFMSVAMDFRGPAAMYEKMGFEKVSTAGNMAVMRKNMKEGAK